MSTNEIKYTNSTTSSILGSSVLVGGAHPKKFKWNDSMNKYDFVWIKECVCERIEHIFPNRILKNRNSIRNELIILRMF